MNEKELFSKVSHLIEEVISLLKEQERLLNKKADGFQRKWDLSKGLIFRNGLYLPLEVAKHDFYFDWYDIILLASFTDLYEEVYKNLRNDITEFTLRTLAEMGFPKAQILFGTNVSENDKKTYKLIQTLADLGFMGWDHREHVDSYKKLWTRHRNLLTEKQIVIFDKLLESMENRNTELHRQGVVRARKLAGSIQDNLYSQTVVLPLFKPNIYEALSSGFSHMLHGDPLLLNNLFSQRKNPYQHILRAYWFLLVTGVNMINQAAIQANDPAIKGKTQAINETFGVTGPRVQQFWSSIDRIAYNSIGVQNEDF